MKSRILITGGSGFIGSHLVNKLIHANYEVAITTKYDSIYENIRLFNNWKKIKVIECDLRHLHRFTNFILFLLFKFI